ncbi:MAG: hypothetical protein QM501_15445 [Gimesia sp.]
MNETKYSQFKDRSNVGKPSPVRWLIPLLLISFNILFSALLLVMRATGVLQDPQSYLPLLTIGGLLSCVSFGALLLIRAFRLMDLSVGQQNGLTLVAVLPVVFGMLALLPMAAVTMPGVIFLSMAYFLGFAGVFELINRERLQSHTTEMLSSKTQIEPNLPTQEEFTQVVEESPDEVQNPIVVEDELFAETPDIIEENNEALLEALLGQEDSFQEPIESDEGEEYRSQWMNRTADSNGVEQVEGGALVQFSKNQKVSIVHIGLFPPFVGKMSVVCEFESDMPVRFRILEMRGYGISVEVKRAQELDTEFNTYLHYRISDQQFNEDVA